MHTSKITRNITGDQTVTQYGVRMPNGEIIWGNVDEKGRSMIVTEAGRSYQLGGDPTLHQYGFRDYQRDFLAALRAMHVEAAAPVLVSRVIEIAVHVTAEA